LKAVRDHDSDAAEVAMRKHMQAVLDRLKLQELTNAR
jgi:DNA-binding GntR family transcriptional regulator